MSVAVKSVRTVIYGAGAAGHSARACVARDAGRTVVAFADSDARKIDTRFEGLRVVGPDALSGDWFDEIVIASHAWREITTALLGRGVSRDRLSVYHTGDDRLAPLTSGAATAPCVLVLTDDCVSPGHGIGAVLLRHLASYPAHRLAHVYLRRKGDPFWPNSYALAMGGRGEAGSLSPADIVLRLAASGHMPDVIYANVFGESGLEALEALTDAFGGSVPVIQHFHDWLYTDRDAFARLLQRLSSRVAEFWAITDALGQDIGDVVGREVRTVNTFKCEIAATHKRDHRELDARFKVVMLGNSHMPWVLHHVRNVWRQMQQQVPGIGPIQWFAYPTSVLYVREAGVEIGPEIEYYGYLNDRVLHEHLCDADLALVPFNIADEPEYHYAAHSVPSRITEFMNAGLPIMAAAGTKTETFRFITARGIGVCSTIADESRFAGTLLALMKDTAQRLALSRQGRAYAEAHCDVRKHQEMLKSAFVRVSDWRQGRPID
jgi:glycosyltransferase involved in cell wall biosynthesis